VTCAESLVVVQQRRRVQHHPLEASQQLADVVVDLLDQRHRRVQPERIEKLQRCQAQQLREPGVEGVDLHVGAGAEHARLQPRQRGLEARRLCWRYAAHAQCLAALVARGVGKLAQPFVQPRAHLAGRLAGERDRQDLVGRRPASSARTMRDTSIQVLPAPAHACTTPLRDGSHANA
jgi:hypothetical protein